MKKLFFFVLLLAMTNSAFAVVLYSDRTTFEATLASSVTDTYEDPSYNFINSDAEMSAVLGETQYTTTGFSNWNIVTGSGDKAYCSGCNGSFLLDFTSTSVGNSSGVFGVGFDIHSVQNVYGTVAFVTFGDGSTQNYTLPNVNVSTGDFFWGITDELLIASIHFGLLDGGTNTDGSVQRMALDDLTIGSAANVPEPSTLLLLAIGLFGFGLLRKAAR